MMNIFRRLIREEDGQDLIEYSLLAALLAVACIGAMSSLSSSTTGLFSRTTTSLGS
jgi:pilus assembly protein Flp/PilA